MTEETTETKTTATPKITKIDLASYNPTMVTLTMEQLRDAESTGNWRTEDDYLELAPIRWAEIDAFGQETPIWVYYVEGKLFVARGHTRRRAFMFGEDLHGPEEFTNRLPTGVLALVLECTHAQAALLKNDNAHSTNMRDGEAGKMDYQNAGNAMFAVGTDRVDVRAQLESQIENSARAEDARKLGPDLTVCRTDMRSLDVTLVEIAGKVKATQAKIDATDSAEAKEAFTGWIDTLRANVSEAASKRTVLVTTEATLLNKIRKGIMDKVTQHYQCGVYADWVQFRHVNKRAHPDETISTLGVSYGTKDFLPQLARAVKADYGLGDFDPKKFTPEQRVECLKGEQFLLQVAKFHKNATKAADKKAKAAADKEAGIGTESKGKRMDSAAIQAWGNESDANGTTVLAQVFSGKVSRTDPGVEDKLSTAIGDLEIAELIRLHRPTFWRESCVSLAATIRAELATKVAEAKLLDTTPLVEAVVTPDADEQIVVEGPAVGTVKPKAKAKGKRKSGRAKTAK